MGALLLSPYSDRVGRRTLYIGSAFLYSVFCIPVAVTSDIAGVFAGRLITGVISAVPAITIRLSIEDLFDAEDRMWAFFPWALVTNLGLVLGPVYASYVAASLDWYVFYSLSPFTRGEGGKRQSNVHYRRWPFYLASIIVAVTGMLMYFIRESHSSLLLEHTVAAIRFHRPDLILRTAPVDPRPSIVQPLILLVTRPSIFLPSLAHAFSTALLYLFAVAFPLIYTHYEWNRQKTTLIFLFIALGLFLSTLTRFHDRHAIRRNRLAKHRLTPEKTLFGLTIGAPALAMGLWWFAWTIPGPLVKTLSWPASALSLILAGYGINEHTTVLTRYVLNPHSHSQSHNSNNNNNNNDASSAFAALLTLRALLSALFPLFTTQMFETLGTNTAGSVLAAIATASCLLPFFLINLAGGWRRSDEFGIGDSDSAQSATTSEPETDTKPKKTVRWDVDETDSITSTDTGFPTTDPDPDTKPTSPHAVRTAIHIHHPRRFEPTDSQPSSSSSPLATKPKPEMEDKDRGSIDPIPTLTTATKAPRKRGTATPEPEAFLEPEREAGCLAVGMGMGLGLDVDVERVVGFPYL